MCGCYIPVQCYRQLCVTDHRDLALTYGAHCACTEVSAPATHWQLIDYKILSLTYHCTSACMVLHR